jgi:hypothetical protein
MCSELEIHRYLLLACVRQTMHTADRNIPSSQLFALPCLHVILAAYLIFPRYLLLA